MPEDVGGASPRHSREEPGARPLILLTLAGDELPVTVDPTAHVSLQSFENAVLERLPHLGSNTTLGCEQSGCRVVETTKFSHKPFPFAQKSVTHSLRDCRRGCVEELSTVANRPLARHSRQPIAWRL